MDTREILTKVKADELSVEEAEGLLRRQPFEELDYAKLDTHRDLRQGLPEVIFCQGKAEPHLTGIYRRMYEHAGFVFGTRATEAQAEAVRLAMPGIPVEYDAISGILTAGVRPDRRGTGCIAVCTGGTADIPVAEEASQTAEYMGSHVERIYDVGVSGIHRLLTKLETVQQANCLVAVAGMEGALASVLGGLVDKPVIAVPTSVGYGASFGGLSALLTMINSCANGVAVVNIDNGFGAGYMASLINRMKE